MRCSPSSPRFPESCEIAALPRSEIRVLGVNDCRGQTALRNSRLAAGGAVHARWARREGVLAGVRRRCGGMTAGRRQCEGSSFYCTGSVWFLEMAGTSTFARSHPRKGRGASSMSSCQEVARASSLRRLVSSRRRWQAGEEVVTWDEVAVGEVARRDEASSWGPFEVEGCPRREAPL